MQFFFQELYSDIDHNSGEKFEGMFLVKIASKGTSLRASHPLRDFIVVFPQKPLENEIFLPFRPNFPPIPP